MERQLMKEDLLNISISSGLYENNQLYGEASAEFIKGLRGIDSQTGKVFDRSLSKISEYSTGNNFEKPSYLEAIFGLSEKSITPTIKAQAGFSAEVASVSRKNAEAIIEGSKNRFSRSEDIAKYGKNHSVIDIIELFGDLEISTSQMKFVTNMEGLLKKIAQGEGGGKNDLSRYLSVDKLEVPTDQVESMKKICREQAESFLKQAEAIEKRGDIELAKKLRRNANNYKILESKISDAGLTTEQAIEYRLFPRIATAKDIARMSHRAGIEGAKFGLAIGGSIALVTNIIAFCYDDKEFSEAIFDTVSKTAMSAGVGYITGFSGSAITAFMQQSKHSITRDLSKTNLPSMVVSTCLSTAQFIKKFINNEITGSELLEQLGQTTTSNLASASFSTISQMLIPVPVLGSIIGGMIGYTLSNIFYQSCLDALKATKKSEEDFLLIKMKCEAAKQASNQYEIKMDEIFSKKISQIDNETIVFFEKLKTIHSKSADEYFDTLNDFASVFGKSLTLKNMQEFDDAMLSQNAFKF